MDKNLKNEMSSEENLYTSEGIRYSNDLEAIYSVPITVSAVLGRANMQVSQLLKLGRGAVVELDRRIGDSIDILVNNRLIARGEIVMLDESKLGITMTEIVKSDKFEEDKIN